MKLAIFDPLNHSPGLKLVFPEAEYFVQDTSNGMKHPATRHMDLWEFNSIYGFNYRTDWDTITSDSYDILFIVLYYYDFFTKAHPIANKIWDRLETTLLSKSQSFKQICLFDTSDYDYDPTLLYPELPITMFFKRNMNKYKVYAPNVVPFPFILFGLPCPIYMFLSGKYNYTNTQEQDGVVWMGGLWRHEDTITIHTTSYPIVKDRKAMHDQLKDYLDTKQYVYTNYEIYNNPYMNTLTKYKYALDLEGSGDPNTKTFEIMCTGGLRMHNNTDMIWPFEDEFSEYSKFKTKEEFIRKLETLKNNPNLYKEAIDTQNKIVKKYFTKEWMRNYICTKGML